MKEIISRSARRVGVAEAKAHLSSILREAQTSLVVVHSRGRDLAVLVGIEEYEQLSRDAERESPVAKLLVRVADLKRRLGGGVDDFTPPRAKLRASYPFRAR